MEGLGRNIRKEVHCTPEECKDMREQKHIVYLGRSKYFDIITA